MTREVFGSACWLSLTPEPNVGRPARFYVLSPSHFGPKLGCIEALVALSEGERHAQECAPQDHDSFVRGKGVGGIRPVQGPEGLAVTGRQARQVHLPAQQCRAFLAQAATPEPDPGDVGVRTRPAVGHQRTGIGIRDRLRSVVSNAPVCAPMPMMVHSPWRGCLAPRPPRRTDEGPNGLWSPERARRVTPASTAVSSRPAAEDAAAHGAHSGSAR